MLRLESLSKRFGDTQAVADLTLEVGRGEFLSLLGPSGCGKTTTLRMIAGFETPTAGRIVLNGRDVTGLPPQKRGMGMVFQSYALFPHLDVYGNVEFGLRSQGVSPSEIPARVASALERVDLTGYGERKVQELSGGQQQRVALARALAPEPPLLLLDEPLSNLDAALRERTRAELRELLKRVGITAIFVTHDQEEAFDLSDRIAVLDKGRLQQVGSPEELYGTPANEFVGGFVGRASMLRGRIVEVASGAGDRGTAEIIGSGLWPVRLGTGVIAGRSVRILVRPESIRMRVLASGDEPPVEHPREAVVARVLERRYAGPYTMYRVTVDGSGDVIVAAGPHTASPGDTVALTLAPDAVAHAFVSPERQPETGIPVAPPPRGAR